MIFSKHINSLIKTKFKYAVGCERIMSNFNIITLINHLNNKKYSDLNENLKKFIKNMYPKIQSNDIIYCFKIYNKKIDFIVSVNNIKKNIAIKGSDIVCVYKDYIQNLMLFLYSIKVSSKCVGALLKYHYADGTYNGSGENVNSYGSLLSIDYKKEIKIVEKEFSDLNKLEKVLDYVLFNDNNGRTVDYFYFGDARKGVFASANQVKKNILEESNKYQHNFMRIGVMNFLPLKRSLLTIDKYDNKRHICLLRINLKKYIKK